MVATNHMMIKFVIFNFSQLNCWIIFSGNLHFFSSHTFKKKQNGRSMWRDFMLANLDLDEDIEVSSGLFIDEESHELVLQEDDIFCLDKESEGVKEIPAVIYFDENLTKSKCLFLTDWAQKDHVPLHPINMFLQSAVKFIYVHKFINNKRI